MKKKLFKTAYGIAICFILLGLCSCGEEAPPVPTSPLNNQKNASMTALDSIYNETPSQSTNLDSYNLTISKTLNHKE